MIIADHINYRLSSGLNGSCIVTGLDSSGKSTMISTLYNKYHCHKPISWDTGDWPPTGYNWDELRWYQIHDRFYPIESYVYSDCTRPGSDLSKKIMEMNILRYIKELEKGNGKPMFVFYLHNVWRKGDSRDQPWYTDNEEYRNNILNRYLDVVDVLTRHGYHVVICTRKYMRVVN